MAEIAEKVFIDVFDKYLKLANEEYVRTMAIGNDFTRLRIGAMVAIEPDGTNNIAAIGGGFGLSAGKANPFGSAAPDHVVGMPFCRFFSDTTPGSLTYTAGVAQPYFVASSAPNGGKRVGATLNLATQNMINPYRIATTTGLARRSIIICEMKKGAPWEVGGWALTTAQAEADQSIDVFKSVLSQAGTPNIGGTNLQGRVNGCNLTVDEGANGNLDSVFLWWNKVATPLHVYAIGAFRFLS